MKITSFFSIILIFLVSCTKENSLNISRTDTVYNIFYFNAITENDTISKNLSWYDTDSYYNATHTEVYDETRLIYSWTSDNSSFHTTHYSPDYYNVLKGGSIGMIIADSTLMDKMVGNTIRSNAYGDTLELFFNIQLGDMYYWSKGSVFDFRINSLTDTTLVTSINRGQSDVRIFDISIPTIEVANYYDSTDFATIKDIRMRVPIKL
jgi:hypothetical protein